MLILQPILFEFFYDVIKLETFNWLGSMHSCWTVTVLRKPSCSSYFCHSVGDGEGSHLCYSCSPTGEEKHQAGLYPSVLEHTEDWFFLATAYYHAPFHYQAPK